MNDLIKDVYRAFFGASIYNLGFEHLAFINKYKINKTEWFDIKII